MLVYVFVCVAAANYRCKQVSLVIELWRNARDFGEWFVFVFLPRSKSLAAYRYHRYIVSDFSQFLSLCSLA
jgi:hypothetical protein